MAKLASIHRRTNICLLTCKTCLTNIKCLKNLVVVKQGSKDRLLKLSRANNVSQFRQALRAGGGNDTKCAVQNMEGSRVFPRPFRRGGDLSPIWGDKVLMGAPLRGDIDIMGGT